MAAYGVTDDGNWEGRTILSRVWPDIHTPPPSREDARFEAELASARARLLGAALGAAAAGPRRQGARRLERPRDRGLRRCRAAPATRRCGRRGPVSSRGRPRGRGDHRRAAGRGRLAGALVEGRPGDRPGRAGGLHAPRRRPARALRGHLRRALVHDGPGADGPGAGAVRRSGGRVLRHRRRPRAARRPTQGPPGQRGPVGERRSRPWSCSAWPPGPARAGTATPPSAALRTVGRVRRPLSDRLRPVAVGDGSRPGRRPWRWRSSATPADPATRALARGRRDRLPPAPGRGRAAPTPADERRSAAGRPGRDRRPTDRVRLPRVRVSPARHRARAPCRPSCPRRSRRAAEAQGIATTMVVPFESPSGSWFSDLR